MADRIATRLRQSRGANAASVLSFDAYYHDQVDLTVEQRANVNYDHPDSLDHELLVEHLHALASNQSVAVPVYDFTSHCRSTDIHIVEPSEVVVVEGILLFAFEAVRRELDLLVFRRCPEDVRFSRRIKRDIAERGRSLDSIEAQLSATVKPMHDQFVEPFASEADYITEHGQDLALVTAEVVDMVVNLTTADQA